MIYELNNAYLTVKIDSLGAELISVTRGEYEYVWSGEAWGEHAPLLFPIAGRIKDGRYAAGGKEYRMGAHGFAKRSQFTVLHCDSERLLLSLTSDGQTREIYPYDFTLTAEYILSDERLSLNLKVTGNTDGVMPYMIGWHPGFALTGEVSDWTVDFHGPESLRLHPLQNGCFVNPVSVNYPLENGKYRINDGELARVDTLIFRDTLGKATLKSDYEKRSVTLGWSDNLSYLCIWKAPGENNKFVCLEPWSDVPADGVTDECFDKRVMSRLSGGESAIYSYTVDFK